MRHPAIAKFRTALPPTALGVLCAWLASGCATQIERKGFPEGAQAPTWYNRMPPPPDKESMFFIGYDKAAMSAPEAQVAAEQAARARAAAFLNSDLVESMDKWIERQGSDWSKTLDQRGILAWLGLQGGAATPPSDQIRDSLRLKVNSMVAESVRLCRAVDMYTERVWFQRGLFGLIQERFDAGVLVAMPMAEVDRFKRMLDAQERQGGATASSLDRLETMWKAGQQEAALAEAESLHRTHPTDGHITYRLGQMQRDAGKTEAALQTFAALANRLPADEWTALARGDLVAMTEARAAGMVSLLSAHGVKGSDLADVVIWTRDNQFDRARQMARRKFESGGTNDVHLWTWHMISSAQARQPGFSQAARYDYEDSRIKTVERIKAWRTPAEAEPAISTLLFFVSQGLVRDASLDGLDSIRERFPREKTWSPGLQEIASKSLGDATDDRSRRLNAWLHGKT